MTEEMHHCCSYLLFQDDAEVRRSQTSVCLTEWTFMERSVKWLTIKRTLNAQHCNMNVSPVQLDLKERSCHFVPFFFQLGLISLCVLLLGCQLIYLEHGAERIQRMLWWRQSWTPFHPMMNSLFYYELWPECEKKVKSSQVKSYVLPTEDYLVPRLSLVFLLRWLLIIGLSIC